MIIVRLIPKEYGRTFSMPQHVYNSVKFTGLNVEKVAQVHYLAFCSDEGKPRLGLTVGETAVGQFRAPWSAPFSGFDFNREMSVETMLEAVALLRAGFNGLRLVLPPAPYSPAMNSKTLLALQGSQITYDWNYHIDLTKDYMSQLGSAAKNKLTQALHEALPFIYGEDLLEKAYEIIRQNRHGKGYPLRMSLDAVRETTSHAVKAQFFLLGDVASAMVYEVAPAIAQVIYWGDVPDHNAKFPMNRLAFELAGYYAARGYRTLDIGPSSEDGVPSPGLCAFKESVGCQISPKPTIII